MATSSPQSIDIELPGNVRFAVVATRWNADVVERLLSACVGRLRELGVDDTRVETFRVPGAFELPAIANLLAQKKRYDAVICLGCVVRGDTPHFDYVAGETARGIQEVSVRTGVPVIFGVLTTNTQEQADVRSGGPGAEGSGHAHAGTAAANAAAEMAALVKKLARQTSGM